MSDAKMGRALGWASLGIGLAEILAPKFLEKTMGIGDHRGLLRSLGARELVSGLGILSQRRPTQGMAAGLWSRVAGDVMDLSLLGAAARRSSKPGALAVVVALVLGIFLADAWYATRVQKDARQER